MNPDFFSDIVEAKEGSGIFGFGHSLEYVERDSDWIPPSQTHQSGHDVKMGGCVIK
jgi:hypothetical protein